MDFAGCPIFKMYDPATATINSAGSRHHFIDSLPATSFLQTEFPPRPRDPGSDSEAELELVNFSASGQFYKLQLIPSIKIDHSLRENIRLSGYYSWETRTNRTN